MTGAEAVSSWSFFGRLRRRLGGDTSELVLACLLLLENRIIHRILTLYAIHLLISQIDPPSSRFRFIRRPIPYSADLTDFLDELTASQRLERFTIFDDGNHPQTVYRLTQQGRISAQPWLLRLPRHAESVAATVSSEVRSDNVDREVKLVESLGLALVR